MALFNTDKKPASTSTTREFDTRSRLPESRVDVGRDAIPMPKAAEVVVSDPTPVKPVVGQVVDGKEVNRRLAGLARSIRTHQRKATEEILKCGQALSEAQDLLADHAGGTFSKWLKEKCDMSRSSAYRLIGIYEKFGACANVGRLADADALRRLSGGPAPAIVKAITLLDDGQRVDMATAKQLIAAASPTKPKPEVHVQHIDVPGLGVMVIRSATKVDPQRFLLAAMKSLRGDEPKAA